MCFYEYLHSIWHFLQALLAEGQFYSDIELTEKEIERMVMEASRAEYLAGDKLKRQLACGDSSTSGAEPSSSGQSEYFMFLVFFVHCMICAKSKQKQALFMEAVDDLVRF